MSGRDLAGRPSSTSDLPLRVAGVDIAGHLIEKVARLPPSSAAWPLLYTLYACGGGASSTSGSGAPPAAPVEASEISQEHNAADVEFAQQMIPHHRQATEMARRSSRSSSTGTATVRPSHGQPPRKR